MDLIYHVVDVFTTTPLEGNALAVFPDASELDTNLMQRITKELNLSETTFILPAEKREGSTRVRIFTPGAEMEFAGHPTIGTAYIMRRLGMVKPKATSFTLAENVGPVNVRVDVGDDPLLWLTTPDISDLMVISRKTAAATLSLNESDLTPDLPCEIMSAGNPTLLVPLRDRDTVDRAALNAPLLQRIQDESKIPAVLFAFTPTQTGAYSRMFAPHLGVPEDPATGSSTGPLARFMMKHRLVEQQDGTRLISEQGTKMGRRSLLHVLIHGTNGSAGIEVGGNVAYVAMARLSLPTYAQPA